jgi:hypothetical protein
MDPRQGQLVVGLPTTRDEERSVDRPLVLARVVRATLGPLVEGVLQPPGVLPSSYPSEQSPGGYGEQLCSRIVLGCTQVVRRQQRVLVREQKEGGL